MALEEKLTEEEKAEILNELEIYRREVLAKSLFFIGMRNNQPDIHFGTAISFHALCSLDFEGYLDIAFKELLSGRNNDLKPLMANHLVDMLGMDQTGFDTFLERYSPLKYSYTHSQRIRGGDTLGIAMTLLRTAEDNKQFFAECKSKVDSNLLSVIRGGLNFINERCLNFEQVNPSAVIAYQQAATLLCFTLHLNNHQFQIGDDEYQAMISYLNSQYSASKSREEIVSDFKEVISHVYNELPYPSEGKNSEFRGQPGGFAYNITLSNLEEELLWRIKFLLPFRVDFYTKLTQSISSGKAKNLEELLEISSIYMPYEPVQKLGEGRGGKVYLVRPPELKQLRAIKVLNNAVFKPREAELLAKLSGQDLENIVQIHDAGTHLALVKQKRMYTILMEYVDGQTLEEILKERKLTPHEVLDYSAQILNGIQSLRKHGITHRDLNLRNIKVNRQGEVKILDFGIATDELHPEAKDNRKYGAPQGEEADDLISFGLLVYKMATGKHLIEVPRKEVMGHDTYADEIDRMKPLLYHNGESVKEYWEKIWNISKDVYDYDNDEYNCSGNEECSNRNKLVEIICSALTRRGIKALKETYPFPYRYKIMDANELRKLLHTEHVTHAMERGKRIFDDYITEMKQKQK